MAFLSFDVENIHLSFKPDWFTAMNPLGSVPVLCHGDLVVMDSPNVVHYINEAFEGPTLSSDNPVIKAKQGSFMSIYQSKVVGAYYKIIKGQTEEEISAGRNALPIALEWLDQEMSRKETKFLHGDSHPGVADIMIFPWLPFIKAVQELGMVELQWDNYPNLASLSSTKTL